MKETVINILHSRFNEARTKNSLYSLRAFAKQIGIQPSAASEIMNGKRALTEKMATTILEGLSYSPDEVDSILKQEVRKVETLNTDYFKVMSDWWYFAILSLSETNEFSTSEKWIAQRLNIPERTAKQAVERLKKLGMLEKVSGQWISQNTNFKTPTDIANSSLKHHTIQTLHLAQESLLNDPLDLRDFSTVTMTIDPSEIKHAKKMISTFRKRFMKKIEATEKKEVYKLAIQFFPLTKNTTGEKNENI
jgi:uncharacterized protein (TIGR02147 family)